MTVPELTNQPRFMTVKTTNWAVNTTVASKASSVTSSIVQASQQRPALQTNKTGMVTKPQFAYTMYKCPPAGFGFIVELATDLDVSLAVFV
jgi:hypothetical protein